MTVRRASRAYQPILRPTNSSCGNFYAQVDAEYEVVQILRQNMGHGPRLLVEVPSDATITARHHRVPDAATFTAAVVRYFNARPGLWLPCDRPRGRWRPGGARRTRVSDARRLYGLTIENRCRRVRRGRRHDVDAQRI